MLFPFLPLSVLTSPAVAQLPSPRAAIHEGYARIVFDWPSPVGYSASIDAGQLILRFDRPIVGDVQSLAMPLANVARGVLLSEDRKTATFPLFHPMTVKATAGANNSVIIDLAESGPPAEAAALPAVDARAGDHGGYVRLVFDWPSPTAYQIDKRGGRASIVFAKAGRLDLAALQSGLPSDVGASVDASARTLALMLEVPADSRLRHFTTANKVVVDVVRATDSPAPPDSAKVPLAPAPGADVPAPSLSAPSPKTGLTPVKPTPEPKNGPSAPPAVAPPPSETPSPAKPLPPGKVFSLSVPMTKPAAAAAFFRAGYFWLVFDRRAEVDTALLRRLGGEAVLAVEQLANPDATVLRLVLQPGFYPVLRKEGLLWVVDLTEQPTRPKDLIQVVVPANLPTGIGMALRTPDSGGLISVTDPEIGDVMKVVPVIPPNQGVFPGRDAPDLELLDTTQGIAIIPHVDGLDIRSNRNGVTVGTYSPGGLRFSSEVEAAPRDAAGGDKGTLNLGAWKRGGEGSFQADRKIVEAGMAGVSPSRRAQAFLQGARFYFANGYAPETLGLLRMALADQPDLAESPGVKVMKGGSEAILAQWDLARADLDDPQLEGDAESQMWRAAAHVGDADISLPAGSDSPAAWSPPLVGGLPLLHAYQHKLKWFMATAAAKAAIAAGDAQGAQQALALLDREPADKAEDPERIYLHAAFDEMEGHFERAIDEYETAAEGENRQYRALSNYAATELRLRTRKIKPKDAADALDKLRFSWREEPFEFNLLFRYAQVQQEAGDYPGALRALRSLIGYYPEDQNTPKAAKLMNDMFNALYLQGAADGLPPVAAIALFDEFRDLTPPGAEGDEMIRKLADRLVRVDLLDRAAELLKHQVTNRLAGPDKGRVGARLAVLDLMNRDPQGSLDGLAASETPGLPADLVVQRKRLKAQALSDLGREAEAVQALEGDATREGLKLKAEIHWKAQDWPAVADDDAVLLPRPERGVTFDDASAQLCLGWATALVLGNDERGLAGLRRNYGQAMAGTPLKDAFNLLTSALDRDLPNLPDIVGKIREAEGFRSFMNDYRQRMKDSGLSAIN